MTVRPTRPGVPDHDPAPVEGRKPGRWGKRVGAFFIALGVLASFAALALLYATDRRITNQGDRITQQETNVTKLERLERENRAQAKDLAELGRRLDSDPDRAGIQLRRGPAGPVGPGGRRGRRGSEGLRGDRGGSGPDGDAGENGADDRTGPPGRPPTAAEILAAVAAYLQANPITPPAPLPPVAPDPAAVRVVVCQVLAGLTPPLACPPP